MKPHLLTPHIIKREFLSLVERGTVVPVHMCTVGCHIGDSFGEEMLILLTDFSWSKQTTHIPLHALTLSLNEFSDFYLAPIVEVHCQRSRPSHQLKEKS